MEHNRLEDLPPTISVDKLSEILQIGRRQAYEAVRTGQVDALRIGRRWLVLTRPLLERLGVTGQQSEGPAGAPARAGLQPLAASGAPAAPLGGEE